MEEVQRNQEELAAAAKQLQQQQKRSSRSSSSSRPRSLMILGAEATGGGGGANGAFDAAAALLLRRNGGNKTSQGFNISNGGLPSASPSDSDSAAAVASLDAAIAVREAGEAAAVKSSSGGLPPRWRERHGAAGVDRRDRRSSAIVECALLLAECCRARLRTLAFCKTRKLAELVAAHASQALKEAEEREEKEENGGGSSSSRRRKKTKTKTKTSPSSQPQPPLLPPLSSRVAAYRAGYDPTARRAIEQALASGRVLGVAATNALELGIDLPLDVTLHLGLPPRAATLAQQSGRAGRKDGAASLHIVIAFDGPLDQWYVRHPERFFGRAAEAAGGGFDPFPAAPENGTTTETTTTTTTPAASKVDEGILALHITCAAAECPPLDCSGTGDDARIYFGPRLPAVALELVKRGVLVGGDFWSGGGNQNPTTLSSSSGRQQQRQRHSDYDRDAAAEAVVARRTPLYFAGGVSAAPAASGASSGSSLFSSAAPPSFSSLPHSTFGLRAIDETRFSIVDDATGALLEEMEASKAFFVV